MVFGIGGKKPASTAGNAQSSRSVEAAAHDEHREQDRDAEADQPLVGVQHGTKTKSEWLAQADKSECSKNIEAFYQRTDPQNKKVQELKKQMFDQIYDVMGNEVPAFELEQAVVVKTVKFHPIMAGILKVVTLGLFSIFRPRDDDTALVLTKHGHVLMHKIERPNFLGKNGRVAIMLLMRYILILVVIFSFPSILYAVAHVEIDERTWAKLKRNTWLLFSLCAILAALFGVWLMTKCPHDYGNRIRQNHAAGALCAGQFTLSGSARHRTGTLRLFFGKYPPQILLDLPGNLATGQVAGPIPPKQLTIAGVFAKSSGIISALTIVLSVITILDTGFGWVDRSVALATYASHHHFCLVTKEPAECNPEACVTWAANVQHTNDEFCTKVRWYGHSQDPDDQAICLQYGHLHPPCCGGCTLGEAAGYLSSGVAAFREILSVLGDIGTLIFSFMAARSAIGIATATDSIDLSFKRMATDREMYELSRTSNFDLTQPLALQFAEEVCKKAYAATSKGEAGPVMDNTVGGGGAGSRPPPPPPPPPTGTQPDEPSPSATREFKDEDDPDMPTVNRFKVESQAVHWDSFFKEEKLIIPGKTKWTSTINIPPRCLGIPEDEQVLAAWVEMPSMTLASLIPVAALSIALFCTYEFWPSESGVKVSAFRMAMGVVFTLVFFGICCAIQYIFVFAAIEHVVIVTSQRIFYVRHRKPCSLLCMFGTELRVDFFRHDSDIFYGHLHTTMLPVTQRLQCAKWFPGEVYLQVKYGVLSLVRSYGNAVDVYDIVSKLTRAEPLISREDLRGNGVDMDFCQADIDSNLYDNGNSVWTIARRPDDVALKDPQLWLAGAEQPLFYWSVKESGMVGSGYDKNTDIVVTTQRVFLWNRALYKTFDCMTCCCWGMCWCACFNRLFNAARLPSQMSFLTLSALLSFSTEVIVQPPVWYDPHHTPLKFPCLEKCCENLTRCFTRDKRGYSCGCHKEACCPRRSGARTQLWLMWRLKQNAQQPDLQCSIRPYALPEQNDEEFWDGLDFLNQKSVRELNPAHDYNIHKTETLRQVMQVAQRASNRM